MNRIGIRRIDYPIPSGYFHRQPTVLVHLAPFGRIHRHFYDSLAFRCRRPSCASNRFPRCGLLGPSSLLRFELWSLFDRHFFRCCARSSRTCRSARRRRSTDVLLRGAAATAGRGCSSTGRLWHIRPDDGSQNHWRAAQRIGQSDKSARHHN